jgi:pimeloyl-ACP methyl ester carboxylesterase
MLNIRSKDGASIACSCIGDGPPILLVHGSGTDGARWTPILPGLKNLFTVYSLDRRGHGKSGDGQHYSIENEFDDIALCIDRVAEGPVDVLAHSYGALCSLGAATRTDWLRRLILYEPPLGASPGAYCPKGVLPLMRAAVAGGDPEAAIACFAREVLGLTAQELAAMQNLAMWADMVQSAPILLRELESVERYTMRADAFAGCAVPVLLLLGTESAPQYHATAELLNRTLRHCRIARLEGQRHTAINAAPELVARTVIEFLS